MARPCQVKKIFRPSRALCLLACLILAGCATPWVDAGPNPARLEVRLKAQVTPGQIHDALAEAHLTPPIVLPGLFHEVKGPYWDWGVYLVKDPDNLLDLKPDREQAFKGLPGLALQGQSTFLAPPGGGRIRLLVQCYMLHSWSEGIAASYTEPVPVRTFHKDWDLNLQPGQTKTIQVNWGPAAGGGN